MFGIDFEIYKRVYICYQCPEKALVSLYGGKAEDTSDILRNKKFSNKAVKRISSVDVQNLTPTSDSAKYHFYRVYHQVQVWMGK